MVRNKPFLGSHLLLSLNFTGEDEPGGQSFTWKTQFCFVWLKKPKETTKPFTNTPGVFLIFHKP